MTEEIETRIGVGVLVMRDHCVLLGERVGSHGAGTWAPPGGHLESYESVHACAQRELFEETSVIARELHDGPWSVNDFPEIARRYATLFVVVRAFDGEPVVREPDKCVTWRWFPWSALRAADAPTLFTPMASLVASGWEPWA